MTELVFLRSMQIGWRVVLVAAVPTMALLVAIAVQAGQQNEAAETAETELRRIEVLDTLTDVQGANVFPELSEVSRVVDDQESPLVSHIVDMMWEISISRYYLAEEARSKLAAAPRQPTAASLRDLPPETRSAYDAQLATVDELLAAWASDERATPEQIARAEQARTNADLALTDLALESTSAAWTIHVAKIDAIRTSWIEYVFLAPTLVGLDVADPDSLAVISGRRVQATERVITTMSAELREEVYAVFESPAYEWWSEASAAALAIARGEMEPWSTLAVSGHMMNAYALALEIDEIASAAVDRTRTEVAVAASEATSTRDRLLIFVALLVSITAVFTAMLLTSVVRPIRILTKRADSIARGEHEAEPEAVGGRDELTELGTVLDSVADGLRHLQYQVEAIADGRFDDPSLDIAAPGPVGAYVQARVEDLRKASGTLRAHAGTDALTGLLNRRGLVERLQKHGPGGPDQLVIYIDLDRFKAVNDRHGHRHGDAVLEAVARRLQTLVRPEDSVCRLGGDEFVLVVELERSRVDNFLTRIEAQVGEPVQVDDVSHRVGCSIGVSSLGHGTDLSDDLDAALDQADRRMLRTKSQRRHGLPDTIDTTR